MAPEPDPEPELPPIIRDAPPRVPGRRPKLRRNGKAAIPRGAPKRIRAIIAAANRIVGKPYKWGGGHAKLFDRGYDCSGAVSFALIRTGHLRSPLTSGGFRALAHAEGPLGHDLREPRPRLHGGRRPALRHQRGGRPGGRKGARWRPAIGGRQGFKVRRPAGL